MTMITPSYLGETIEYSSLHACRSTLEDPTDCKALLDGINVKLLSQGDELTVYSGHGPATTVGRERRTNPFLS